MPDSTRCELRFIDNNFYNLEAVQPSNFSTVKPLNRQSPLPHSNKTHILLHHESKQFLWIANKISNETILNEYCSNLDQAECNHHSYGIGKEWLSPRRPVHSLSLAGEIYRLLSEFRNAAKYIPNTHHHLAFIDSEDAFSCIIIIEILQYLFLNRPIESFNHARFFLVFFRIELK